MAHTTVAKLQLRPNPIAESLQRIAKRLREKRERQTTIGLIRASLPRRVAGPDSAYDAKNPGSNPNEVQRQIPFNVAANGCWEESTTPQESATSEVNPPPTWGDLVRAPT